MQTHTFVLGGSEWAREEWLQTHIWKDLAFQKGLDLRDQPYHLWSFQSDKCLALEKYGCPLDVSGEHHPHCNLVPLPMNSADPGELFSTGLPFCYSSLAFSLVSKVVISYLLHIPLTPPLLLGDAPPSAPKKKKKKPFDEKCPNLSPLNLHFIFTHPTLSYCPASYLWPVPWLLPHSSRYLRVQSPDDSSPHSLPLHLLLCCSHWPHLKG